MKGLFAAYKAKVLRNIGAVFRSRKRSAHRAPAPPNQLIHRFPALFAQQIPQREIDPADGIHHQSLATVIESRKIHLIPDPLDIG